MDYYRSPLFYFLPKALCACTSPKKRSRQVQRSSCARSDPDHRVQTLFARAVPGVSVCVCVCVSWTRWSEQSLYARYCWVNIRLARISQDCFCPESPVECVCVCVCWYNEIHIFRLNYSYVHEVILSRTQYWCVCVCVCAIPLEEKMWGELHANESITNTLH